MIVGLTGGVGSGKTLVSRELNRLGALIVDADIIAREVLAPGEKTFESVVEVFGSGAILTGSGEIDRKYIADIVFNDPERLARLNAIMHPEIINRIATRIKGIRTKVPNAIIVLDAPLLIEVGLHKSMDKVIVVFAEKSQMIKRIMARNKISKADALARIESQLSMESKLRYADFTIDNTGTKEETIRQVRGVVLELELG